MNKYLLFFAILFIQSYANIIEVNPGQNGAYITIQDGIDAASYGDTVLVHDGTYSGEGNRNLTWNGDSKHITLMSVNGPESTIIDAQGWNDGVDSQPSRRVFVFDNSGQNSNDIIDGFTIRNGYLDGSDGHQNGGGIFIYNTSPTFTNCIIRDNKTFRNCHNCDLRGGGIYLYNSSSSFTNCQILNNEIRSEVSYGGDRDAWARGGGVHVDAGNVSFTNCDFKYNTAYVYDYHDHGDSRGYAYGGGLHRWGGGTLTLTDVEFSSNAVDGGGHHYDREGGGIYIYDGTTNINNSTIVYNTFQGLFRYDGTVNVNSSIIWYNGSDDYGSINYYYTNRQASPPSGDGNISLVPWLFDPENEDYSLSPGSVCINRGNPSWDDPDGTRRDMGKYIYEHGHFGPE